ncbi:MAG: ComEC family competence protein [Muribaculaceae bacterium]|nr:ComEC family competence protein [Muribaculaceae bacterium]
MGNLEQALTRNTLLLPASAVCVGVASGTKLQLSWIYGFALLIIAVAIYITVLQLSTNALKTYRLRYFHYVWLCIAFCGLGIIATYFRTPKFYQLSIPDTDYIIEGKVKDVKEQTNGDMLLLDVLQIYDSKGLPCQRNNILIKLNIQGSGGRFIPGDIIRFQSKLGLIENNPNSFYGGYKEMMNSKGIYYSAQIPGANISLIGHKNSIKSYSHKIRNRIEETIEKAPLDKHTQNFLITLLLGDRSYLDPQLKATFTDAGVSHVLALSGMHIAIIGGIFLMLLFPFNFYGKYKLRYVIATTLLWLYTFLSGMAPSTIRACIMITFMTVAILAERKNYAINALSGSVLFILLFAPVTLFDAGFQLSVVCVASLILFTGFINNFFRRIHPRLYKLMETLAATFVATFASWVITCYYFHSFPISFLPANIILLPILPIYLVIAIFYIALASIGIILTPIRYILDGALSYLQKLLTLLGDGNTIELTVDYETVILWMCGLIALAIFLNLYRWKPLLFTGVSCMLFSLILTYRGKESIPTGSFIVCNTYHSVNVTVKQKVKEKSIRINRYKNTQIRIKDKTIVCLDSNTYDCKPNMVCDYLIIAGGFKGDIEDIVSLLNPKQILIHSSVRRKRENHYKQQLESSGYQVHSLRHDNSFVYLSDN